MSYSSTILADSPYGYWRLGEASGTTAVDGSGNGRDLTYGSGAGSYSLSQAGLLAGDADKSVRFQRALAGPNFALNTSTCTIELWLMVPSYVPTTPNRIVGFADGNGSGVHDKELGLASSGALEWYVYDGSMRPTFAAITVDTIYHVVGRIGPSGQSLWINGVRAAFDATVTTSFTGYSGNNFIVAGSSAGFDYFGDITIDEVALYASELPDARILAHYNAGISSGFLIPRSRVVNAGGDGAGGSRGRLVNA